MCSRRLRQRQPDGGLADSGVIRNGCGPAVRATPAVAFTAAVNVLRLCTLSTNDVGVAADENGTVKVMASSLFGNGTATRTTGNGSIDISDPATHVLANSPILKPNSPNVTAAPRAPGSLVRATTRTLAPAPPHARHSLALM